VKFLLTPELEQLQESLRGFFTSEFPAEKRRTYLAESRSDALLSDLQSRWKKFAQLGALYGGVAESSGGLGLGFLSNVILIREAARVLSPLPILETLLFGILPASKLGSSEELLAKLLSGDEIATGATAHGFVPEPRLATSFIAGGPAYSRQAISVKNAPPPLGAELIREQIPSKNLCLNEAAPLGKLSKGQERTLLLERCLLIAAEASGAARAVEEMALAHVLTRKQFDAPIGSFPAIQHKLADCRVAIDAADALIDFAAWSKDNDSDQFEQAALAAYTFAGVRCQEVVEQCLQVHGGIGFTYEYDLHLYLRRILSTVNWFTSPGRTARDLAQAAIA